jgi:hypothetical protein
VDRRYAARMLNIRAVLGKTAIHHGLEEGSTLVTIRGDRSNLSSASKFSHFIRCATFENTDSEGCGP